MGFSQVISFLSLARSLFVKIQDITCSYVLTLKVTL